MLQITIQNAMSFMQNLYLIYATSNSCKNIALQQSLMQSVYFTEQKSLHKLPKNVQHPRMNSVCFSIEILTISYVNICYPVKHTQQTFIYTTASKCQSNSLNIRLYGYTLLLCNTIWHHWWWRCQHNLQYDSQYPYQPIYPQVTKW